MSIRALLRSSWLGLALAAVAGSVVAQQTPIFVNEINYDNVGTDVQEFVEIAGPAGTDLTGWSLVLYNGNGGAPYETISFPPSITIPDQDAGFGVLLFNPTGSSGLQNGAPDGVALVDDSGSVVQFLSYEGSFAAVGGPADGMMSIDIGVSEPSNDPVGQSLQLVGTGEFYEDFTWSGPSSDSSSLVNVGQTFQGNGNGNGAPGQALPLTTSFDDCTGNPSLPPGWTVFSVDSDTANTWSCSDQFGNVQASAFQGTAPADDWLITPALNLDAQGDDTLTFRNQTSFVDNGEAYPQLSVLFSTQYAGSGDPLADGIEIWTEIPDEQINFSTVNSGNFVDSGEIDLSGLSGDAVYFAFRYQSSGTTGNDDTARWRLDEVMFFEDVEDPVPMEVLISAIQGNADNSPLLGELVTVEAIVVADYQDGDQLESFVIQEEDADNDADPSTSEGVFVFCDACPVDVVVGDRVTVTGTVEERFGNTQIVATAADDVVIEAMDQTLPTPAVVELPVPMAFADIEDYYEQFEGMLVTIPQTLVISEYFQLARFGQIVLTEGERPRQFTDANAPSVSGFAEFQAELERSRIILDDNQDGNNADISGPVDEPYFYPRDGLSTTNFFRGGDTITGLTGVLQFAFGDFRVRPVLDVPEFVPEFVSENPRPEAPAAVGGTFKAASYNVLNYFLTIDTTPPDNGPGGADLGDCGPMGSDLDCRGADSVAERERQEAKIVATVCALDADVIGLVEIENDMGQAVQALVNAINAEDNCRDYTPVVTGSLVGTDAIAVGMIYDATTVTPIGATAVLDALSFTNPLNATTPKNRAALAQAFRDNESSEEVLVIVNHYKSKGSPCSDEGDPDLNDGAANCNLTRKAASEALLAWIATDPTDSGLDDEANDNILILGDLNSYRNEDPIVALEDGGYVDLIDVLLGADAYSFVFDGQLGYLDYALASQALEPKITGITEWHTNADEVNVFDYNDTVQDLGEASFERESTALELFEPTPFRSSDHDVVLVGMFTPLVEVPGDLDDDGGVDADDYLTIRGALGTSSGDAGYLAEADYDGDGTISYRDLGLWYGLFRQAQ